VLPQQLGLHAGMPGHRVRVLKADKIPPNIFQTPPAECIAAWNASYYFCSVRLGFAWSLLKNEDSP
jgi:hypothetical protein